MPRKLGKLPAVTDHDAPRLKRLASKVDAPPERQDWHAKVPAWPMLKNDTWDCSVAAAVLHTMLQRALYIAKEPLKVTDADVEAVYKQMNPKWDQATDTTDTGAFLSEAMRTWAKDGFTVGGTLDKPAHYATVGADQAWMKAAIHYFGHCIIGIRCPEKWLTATGLLDIGPVETWNSAGGQVMVAVGYEPGRNGDEFKVVLWGSLMTVTSRALDQVVDEAAVVMDRDFYNAQGYLPAAFLWDQADAAMTALGSADPVIPPPPATPPDPPKGVRGEALGPFWYVRPPMRHAA